MLHNITRAILAVIMCMTASMAFSMENTEERSLIISGHQYESQGTIKMISVNEIIISETSLIFAQGARFYSQDGDLLSVHHFSVGERVSYTATSDGKLLKLRKLTGGKM